MYRYDGYLLFTSSEEEITGGVCPKQGNEYSKSQSESTVASDFFGEVNLDSMTKGELIVLIKGIFKEVEAAVQEEQSEVFDGEMSSDKLMPQKSKSDTKNTPDSTDSKSRTQLTMTIAPEEN